MDLELKVLLERVATALEQNAAALNRAHPPPAVVSSPTSAQGPALVGIPGGRASGTVIDVEPEPGGVVVHDDAVPGGVRPATRDELRAMSERDNFPYR